METNLFICWTNQEMEELELRKRILKKFLVSKLRKMYKSIKSDSVALEST